MGRYTAAVCRLCRREGMKLYLKGEKCYTEKCPVHKRPTPPGMHGARPTRRKASEFGMRLRGTRLDNIVSRRGLAPSRKGARQLVVHGHVAVDGKKVTIPAYQVRPGQAVGLTERGQKHGRLK